MEKARGSKALQMILSLLAAVVLWMYVGSVDTREETATIRNIPVRFVGLELLEDRGLMISEGLDQTVTITCKGKRDAINQLDSDTVTATVDVSNISQAGTYTQAYQVTPNLSGVVTFNSVTTTERYPLNLKFTVVKLAVRKVPVQGSFTGSVAEGYQAGAFSFSPDVIEVRGEEALVNQIEYARVELDKEELSETYSGDLPYTFIAFNGEEMSGEGLETSTALVRATLPVAQLKEVELSVNIIPGGGATEDNVTCRIDPERIIVSGEAADLEPLKEISLGDIDLSKVSGTSVTTFTIPLAAELTNVSGVSEATVRITVSGLATATLEVDNIECIHVPEGYKADPVTASRQIQIRGTPEGVAEVTASQLRIVADFQNTVAATGTQTVPVKVYLDGRGDVGVVGEYNISVSVTREP